MQEADLYREITAAVRPIPSPGAGGLRSVADYARLVRPATWRQAWDEESRTLGEVRDTRGSIYSDAIERSLSLNPDFPRSLPRGGTGRGQIETQ